MDAIPVNQLTRNQ